MWVPWGVLFLKGSWNSIANLRKLSFQVYCLGESHIVNKYVLIFWKGNRFHFDISACQSLTNILQPQRLRFFFNISDVRTPTTSTREIFMEIYFPWKNETKEAYQNRPRSHTFRHSFCMSWTVSSTCPKHALLIHPTSAWKFEGSPA